MKRIIFLLAFSLLILGGCSSKSQPIVVNEKEVNVYFGIKGNESVDFEKRIIEFENDKDKYIKTVQQIIDGPKDINKFEVNINKNTNVLACDIEKGSLTINLSKDFDIFENNVQKTVSVASIVNTLLQFTEIEKVRITIDGNELVSPDGKPYGYMNEIFKDLSGLQPKEINLYFADSQAMFVIPEKRIIDVSKSITDEDLLKFVIEELIKGPTTEGLYKTIPGEVKINNIIVENDLVRIDFSIEMQTKHWRGAAGEQMTVASIVNTLTEFPNIKKVLPTVDGEPMNIEHMYIEEPLTRMEEVIKR